MSATAVCIFWHWHNWPRSHLFAKSFPHFSATHWLMHSNSPFVIASSAFSGSFTYTLRTSYESSGAKSDNSSLMKQLSYVTEISIQNCSIGFQVLYWHWNQSKIEFLPIHLMNVLAILDDIHLQQTWFPPPGHNLYSSMTTYLRHVSTIYANLTALYSIGQSVQVG